MPVRTPLRNLPEPDAVLVTQCLAGYPDAFEGLVLRYQNAAFAIALSYLPDREDAQDLVQEALIDAYCKLEQLRQPERFGCWFRTVVVNHCRTRLRRRQLGSLAYDQAEPQLSRLAFEAHQDHLRTQEIWKTVHQLPEPYRVVTLLYYLSGLSQKDIAVFLDVPLSTVKGRLQQAQQQLRAMIKSMDTPMAHEKERFAMNKIDVSKDVQNILCRIATQPVDHTISLGDTRHLVFYCGIATEIEIRQQDGDEVRVTGTKTSIGLSQEAAQQSVRKIEMLVDREEDYLSNGPHEGEVFSGSSKDKDGKMWASKGTTTAIWTGQYVRQDRGWMFTDIALETLYPVLKDQPKVLPDEIRTLFEAPVTRMTVLRREVEDLVVPVSALTDEVKSVFQINYADNDRVHGVIGHARLALSIPAGVRVTIVGSSHVRASGVANSLILIGCHATLSDIEGEVYLFDSSFDTVSGLRGKLWQRYYRYGGSSYTAGLQCLKREQYECKVRDVTGEIDLDVGHVRLEAENLAGQVKITNRYGVTRLTQHASTRGSPYWLRSTAGECRMALPRKLVDQVTLTLHTLCGELHFDELSKHYTGNDTHTLSASTQPSIRQWGDSLEADFQLQSESGVVAVERLG